MRASRLITQLTIYYVVIGLLVWVAVSLWPDFRGLHLLQAIAEYQRRERRYGGLSPSAEAHHAAPVAK